MPAENDKPSLVTGVFLKNVAWRLYKSISEFALFRVLHNALRLADFHRSSMPKIVVFLETSARTKDVGRGQNGSSVFKCRLQKPAAAVLAGA